LGNLYLRNNRMDLALREFDRYLEITGPPEGDDEAAQEQYERRLRMKKDLEDRIEAIQTAVDKERENKTPPGTLASGLYQSGFVLLALKVLREESEGGELPENDPFVLLLQLEAGEVQTAYQGLMQLESQIAAQVDNARVKQFGLPANSQFRHTVALGALCVGDYDTAIAQWVKQAEEGEKRLTLIRLGTLPMVNRPIAPIPLFMQVDDQWPYFGWQAEAMTSGSMSSSIATALWNAALCQFEVGRPNEGAKLLERMLEIVPTTAYRPMAVVYFQLATEKPMEIYPASIFPPVWDGMFAPGPAVAEKPLRKKPQTGNDKDEK
jgi:tetratricopeptide (TPR) repeat protein